ncbi:LysM peptidoglycan-binding domain-containing protein [Actinomycetospora aeridis]|uniref:LysM peptidoglycan-binding domain-containing protein n=1 Tax=Actinomycetospora aeridis TaxID=3129231 RepID=A0ABU8NET3_9PSEU
MTVGTTGPQGRCDVEVPGPRAAEVAGSVSPGGVAPAAPARVARPVGRPQPAGSRPARPEDVRGPVRPSGRRAATVLPPVRPRVAGGGARRDDAGAPRGAVTPTVLRRRRVAAVAVLGVLLGVLAGVLLGMVVPSGDVPAPSGPAPAGTTVAVVGAGESLTDVAGRVAPGADAGAVVTRIRELNGLEGSAVAPGRPLVVPTAG